MTVTKFRAKCKLKGKWMYGSYRYSGGRHYINSTEVYWQTVGQFTGLLDPSGKEMYEGDIMKVVDTNWGYGGDYDKTHTRYMYIVIESIDHYLREETDYTLLYLSCGEVFGNRYEGDV